MATLREQATDLLQKRMRLINENRSLLERAQGEGRALNGEEQAEYDRRMADIDGFRSQADRLVRQADLDAEINSRADTVRPEVEAPTETRQGRASEEYRSAFWQAQRMGRNALEAPEVRALQVGTDSEGGYLVPDEFERQLIVGLEDVNVMRGLATVITTASGDRLIPVESSTGSATWMAEEAAYTESDAAFGRVTLGAHKLGRILKVSEELLQDSAFSIEQYIAGNYGRTFGSAEEAAHVAGDGSGKPTGIVTGATNTEAAAAGAAIAADDLINTFHALPRPYRPRATWLMADSTAKAIRKLKDNDGQYIWQPGLQAGQPDRILARPVAISDSVPAVGLSAKSVIFGDISYYWIADRRGRTMQRLNELYAANGQVGFKMFQRVDGKLTLAEAVVALEHPAA